MMYIFPLMQLKFTTDPTVMEVEPDFSEPVGVGRSPQPITVKQDKK